MVYPEEYEDILEESKNEQDTGIVEIRLYKGNLW